MIVVVGHAVKRACSGESHGAVQLACRKNRESLFAALFVPDSPEKVRE